MTRIRAAILSAGAWSQTSHLPALASDPEVDIVAVSSPDIEAARKSADTFGAQNWYADWREALGQKPDVTVVSSPPSAHEEMVTAALKAGSHVLVEKPFALERNAARRMRDTANAAGRQLLVGFGWPASPIFKLAKQLIDEERVGPVEHVTFHLAVNTRALLEGSTDGGWGGSETSLASTYTDRNISGGGSVAVSMSHQLGLLEWLIDEGIEELHASTYPAGAPIELHATVNAQLRGGGSAAISSASTHPYLARPQWHLGIYGKAGQLWLDSAADYLRLVTADGEVVVHEGAEASGVYDPGAPTKALIACARGAAAPSGLDARLATRVVAITDAIYESAQTGEHVQVDSQ